MGVLLHCTGFLLVNMPLIRPESKLHYIQTFVPFTKTNFDIRCRLGYITIPTVQMPVGPDCRKDPLLKLTLSYTRITIQHPKNLICSYGWWAQQFPHPLRFLVLPESACFVIERGCFFYRLICHGKGNESMSLWQHRGGHRPNKDQLSKQWAGQDITRNPSDKLFLSERIIANSRGNLDWIFGGRKGFTTSYKSGMTNTDCFAFFHFTDQTTISNETCRKTGHGRNS